MELKMPSFGMSMKEGTIVEWKKAVGDKVEEGEVVLEIETEKLTKEIESPVSGTLTEIVAEEGDDIPCGETLAIIEED